MPTYCFPWKDWFEAETPILWPPNAKSWLIRKDPDAGKDWRQEEKETTEDEMVGWHHRLNGHEFEYTPGAGDGQGGLVSCSPWGHKELDMTEWLSWTDCFPTMDFRSHGTLEERHLGQSKGVFLDLSTMFAVFYPKSGSRVSFQCLLSSVQRSGTAWVL